LNKFLKKLIGTLEINEKLETVKFIASRFNCFQSNICAFLVGGVNVICIVVANECFGICRRYHVVDANQFCYSVLSNMKNVLETCKQESIYCRFINLDGNSSL